MNTQELGTISAALSFLPSDQPLLLGLSGGADSVALLHVLLQLGYHNLILCHFNHQLRGTDSEADALFVKQLADSLQLPAEIDQEDVQARASRDRLSLETAAREARYQFFARIAAKRQLTTLLLAHHADDQVETCFFNFLRGSGSAGLAGMLPISQRVIEGTPLTIVRPFLQLSKEQLKKYLEQQQLLFCHDVSNDSLLPMRNRLRHRLFPLIDELFGTTYRTALLRNATILAAEDDYLESLATPWAEAPTLTLENLNTMPLALRRRVIHAWLRKHGFCDVGFAEVERVASLLNLEGPAQVNLPNKRHATRAQGSIVIR